jgi:hypothetical protein
LDYSPDLLSPVVAQSCLVTYAAVETTDTTTDTKISSKHGLCSMDAIDTLFDSEEEISDPKLKLKIWEQQIITAVIDELPELLSGVGMRNLLSVEPDKRQKSVGQLSRRISKVILRALEKRSDQPRGRKAKNQVRDAQIYRLRIDEKRHLSWQQIARIMRLDKYQAQAAFRRYELQLQKNPYKLVQDTLQGRFPHGS